VTEGIPVGRLFGIVIRIHWSWVVILALVAALAAAEVGFAAPELEPALQWLVGGVVAAGFLASAAAHDLGHAIVSRRRGVRVDSISVSFFGGSSPLDAGARTASDEVAIAAAGPIVSLTGGVVLVAASLLVSAVAGTAAPVVTGAATLGVVLGLLNVLLGLVNLVPAYPLDGARLLRALVWARTGSERRGSRWVARSGSWVGFALLGVGAVVATVQDLGNGLMVALSGWFLRLTARGAMQRVEIEELADGLRVGDVMEPAPTTVAANLTVDTFADQLLVGDPPRTTVLVVRGDDVVGVVGAAQLRRLRRAAWPATRVEEIMVPIAEVPELQVDTPIWPAFLQLRDAGLDGAPVARAGGPTAGAGGPTAGAGAATAGAGGHAGLLTVRAIVAALQSRRPSGRRGFRVLG
jgi:Zn-dependent protease/CBS domain-containing protein